MPSESGERRPGRFQQVGAHQAETEHLPCPRCNSTNTKFCYYNNYNLSQPRHFCKACRRYWTQGGTLRNIPVGGGTRKNSKRSRTSSPSTSSSHHDLTTPAISVKPEMLSPPRGDMNLNDNVPPSFTSLLNPQGTGLLALGGFGLGLGPGFDEMGFGLGRGVWPLEQVGEGGCGGASGGNTWQISAVDGGFADGECFAWPDLAISTPGQGLK